MQCINGASNDGSAIASLLINKNERHTSTTARLWNAEALGYGSEDNGGYKGGCQNVARSIVQCHKGKHSAYEYMAQAHG